MIEISKREYPYPVLAAGRDDYAPACSYSININTDEMTVTSDFIEIPVSYELICPSLEKGIEEGKFASVIKVKSGPASFCRLYIFDSEKHMDIKIPKYDVSERIEITGLVVAQETIRDFSCEEMNELYFAGTAFSLRKGDAVAMETPRIIYIDDSELEKPIISIFKINYVEGQEETIKADFYEDRININLNEELNRMYWTLKDFNNGALRRYITAVVVTPALVEAIDIIKLHYSGNPDEDFSDKRWFRAIELKAEQHNYIMRDYCESSTMLADILLGGISLDALKSFKDMLDQEMNNGETQMIGGMD